MRIKLFRSPPGRVLFAVFLLVFGHAQAIAQQRADRLIALIGITAEIAPVEARIETPVVARVQGFGFTSGTIDGTRVVVARSGVGKVNSAIVATLLLERFSPPR